MEVGSKAACRVRADRQLQQLRRANTEISESRLCAGTNAKLRFRIKVAQIIEDFLFAFKLVKTSACLMLVKTLK